MKRLNLFYYIVFLTGCLLVAACKKESISAFPFESNFFTKRVPEKLGEVSCENESLPFPNYQEGDGTANHFGQFHTVLTFCSGEGGVYGDVSGYFEMADGDRLFVKITMGQVRFDLPEPHPVYEAYFQDPFEFVGGTGRFAGASGGGMTNSLVDLFNEDYPFPGPIIPDHQTDHEWTGTIFLPNG